jgi:hypothetical protein
VPGNTKPNECDDDGNAMLDDDCGAVGTGAPLPNDRQCITGPFEQFCGPTQIHHSCNSNADCNSGAGQTCSIGRFRECFDNGVIGDVVTASGVADPPVNDEADPTLAALFCIGQTSAGAVNAAAGLPGLGRLELPGHARGLP